MVHLMLPKLQISFRDIKMAAFIKIMVNGRTVAKQKSPKPAAVVITSKTTMHQIKITTTKALKWS